MATVNNLRISLISNSNDLYEDVFAVSNLHDGTTETTAEGIAATRAIFGGPIRYSELMMRAYATTPNDLTCCMQRYEAEMGVVVALIMKRIDRPESVVAAYKGVGRHKGWMTVGKSGGRIEYALSVVPTMDAGNVYHVTYETSEAVPHLAAPYLVGHADSRTAAPSPGWLAALNLALQKDSDDAWRAYSVAARKAGLSPRSIQTVEKMLQNLDKE